MLGKVQVANIHIGLCFLSKWQIFTLAFDFCSSGKCSHQPFVLLVANVHVGLCFLFY